MILRPIRKVSSDATTWRFFWVARDGFVSGSPTITYTTPATGVSVAAALTVVHADAVITTVADDLRTLTLDSDISSDVQGVIGDWGGEVWIDVGAAYQGPATIRRWASTTTIELAEPLPHDVATTASTVLLLHFQLFQATLATPADALSAGTSRATVAWAVDWSRSVGGSVAASVERDEGLLYVCRQPFNTGCTWRNLAQLVPALGSEVPEAQASWAPQVWEAEAELLEWIREHLPAAKYEDDLNGHVFRGVHGLLAAALVLEGQVAYDRADRAEAYRERARERFDRIIKRIPWLDADRDGIIDAGEENVGLSGLSGVLRSWHTSSNHDEDTFDRIEVGEAR